MIEYLGVKISEKDFANDLILSAYNSNTKTVIELNSTYLENKAEYESLWTLFQDFLNDFPKTSDYKQYKPFNMDSILSYTLDKDAKALNEILAWLKGLSVEFDAINGRFDSICDEKIQLYENEDNLYTFRRSSNSSLEESISTFVDSLLKDV